MSFFFSRPIFMGLQIVTYNLILRDPQNRKLFLNGSKLSPHLKYFSNLANRTSEEFLFDWASAIGWDSCHRRPKVPKP